MNKQALMKIASFLPSKTVATGNPYTTSKGQIILPHYPAVPGIGAPPPTPPDLTIAPPEVKTPAPPVPPQHKSELPEAADRLKWLKDWMAKKRADKSRVEVDPYKIPAQLLR